MQRRGAGEALAVPGILGASAEHEARDRSRFGLTFLSEAAETQAGKAPAGDSSSRLDAATRAAKVAAAASSRRHRRD